MRQRQYVAHGLALAWLGICAGASIQYAGVWTNELTLWLHAIQIAPDKPRPHVQLTLALLERRRFTEAALVLDDTDRILHTCTLPTWDRDEAAAALRHNRNLLSRLLGTGPLPPPSAGAP